MNGISFAKKKSSKPDRNLRPEENFKGVRIMENKKLLNVDLESTDYDPAQVGNLDRRLEVGQKRRRVLSRAGCGGHSDRHHLDVRLRNRRSRRDEVLLGMPMWVSGAIVIYLPCLWWA